MAQDTVLRSISSDINRMSQENGQFRKIATQQNSSISSFIKDISKMFSTNTNQQGQLSNSIGDLQQTSAQTGQKVDQTNNLMQNSISIQTQMLNEMKNTSSTLRELYNLSLNNFNAMSNQQGLLNGGGGMFGPAAKMLAAFAGGGAAGLAASDIFGGDSSIINGIMNAGKYMESGFSDFKTMFAREFFSQNASGSTPENLGMIPGTSDTGGGNKLTVSEMTRLAKEAGFSDEQAAVMGAIGAAESGGDSGTDTIQSGLDPNMQDEFSVGLWQINWKAHKDGILKEMGITDPNQLRDPKINAEAAKRVFDASRGGSFEPWSAFTNGSYQQYLGTAQQSLRERDDASAPPGTIMPQNGPTNSYGGSVRESQSELAGVRKLPLSQRLRSVLEQAAASVGVEAVVYSGGQAAKGTGGPRTGSTRHDNGNAADLYLMKNGRKLSDINPEDREIMAKFVSAAVSAGATGVGAGHGYMGPSNIHVGFGNQATWGGAEWIKQAAAGVFNNMDFSNSGLGGSIASGLNYGGFGGGQNMMMAGAGSPMDLFGGMLPMMLGGMFPGMGSAFGDIVSIGSAIGDITSSIGSLMSSSSENEEMDSYGKNSNIQSANEPKAVMPIQAAALEADSVKFRQPPQQQVQQYVENTPAPQNLNMPRGGQNLTMSSSPSWYLQLAGRIHNDEAMKFKGGVFA